jgi:hypothetical protein
MTTRFADPHGLQDGGSGDIHLTATLYPIPDKQ